MEKDIVDKLVLFAKDNCLAKEAAETITDLRQGIALATARLASLNFNHPTIVEVYNNLSAMLGEEVKNLDIELNEVKKENKNYWYYLLILPLTFALIYILYLYKVF